jgi:hypothetical protein
MHIKTYVNLAADLEDAYREWETVIDRRFREIRGRLTDVQCPTAQKVSSATPAASIGRANSRGS